MKAYIDIPQYTTLSNIKSRGYTLSATQYKSFCIDNQCRKSVGEFLDRELVRTDLGVEVGSESYVEKSKYIFIKTKALQEESYLLNESKDAFEYIPPQNFMKMNLKKGDILISKDSNVGEIVILEKDYPNAMLCGGIYRLPITKNKLYLLAMCKHSIFRDQIDFLVPRGSTIRHGKTKFLECEIPLPVTNTEKTIEYVECLMTATINKEIAIRQKHKMLIKSIDEELQKNQKDGELCYSQPTISEIMSMDRMDSSLYSHKFKKKEYLITNYKYGYDSLTDLGYRGVRGTSLESNYIKNRIDSDVYMPGFYKLIIPTNITPYGTVAKTSYIGTPVKLKTIKKGDIVFGGEGYGKGKSFVVLENEENVATNYHGIRIVCEKDQSMTQKVFVKCVLTYLREKGLIDNYGVGGNGGHFAPAYFYLAKIPNFPEEKVKEIASLYHNNIVEYNTANCTMKDFLEFDNKFNEQVGIYEIDKSLKYLQEKLNLAIRNIADNVEVDIAF